MATTTDRRRVIVAGLSLPAALAVAGTFGPAAAHGPGGHGAPGPVRREQKPWGIAGEPRAVRRTISVAMGDDMRFRPDRIAVKQGETLRISVRNEGRLMHEFVIGDKAELDAHAKLMEKHPGMEHDEPYMVHVEPGKAGDIVWHFNRAGQFHFACLIAGHYSAGMVGQLVVERS
jgi:uncharacterized cupredoxin-like copper-binding protein